MDDTTFWRAFFDMYLALSDWIKLAWLVVPPLFVLGLCHAGIAWARVKAGARAQPAPTPANDNGNMGRK
jgi:hypothetical protein